MTERDIQKLRDVVGTWQARRIEIGLESQNRTSAASLRKFVEVMNAMTRSLIRELDSQDPEFYSALMELAQNAATLTTPGANIFGDGSKMTNL